MIFTNCSALLSFVLFASVAFLSNQTVDGTDNAYRYHCVANSSARTMSGSQNCNTTFIGKADHHKGVNVSSADEPCDIQCFASKLQDSLRHWQKNNVRGVWFEVALEHSDWIPILAKDSQLESACLRQTLLLVQNKMMRQADTKLMSQQNGFRFHHARRGGESMTMSRWLPTRELDHLPVYAHTMVGAGAIVVNSAGELLVVRERYRNVPYWKLPGGYVEQGEDIGEAAKREVLEETNITTELVGLVALRHGHGSLWGCSDMYFIAELRPLSLEIRPAQDEIEACQWMKLEEFKHHPQVHTLNRRLICKYLDNKAAGVAVVTETYNHPVTNAQQTLYSAASKHGLAHV